MWSRISPWDIIRLLNILQQLLLSSSIFPLLPFTYHKIPEVFSKEVPLQQPNVSENDLSKNFQQNMQKSLIVKHTDCSFQVIHALT